MNQDAENAARAAAQAKEQRRREEALAESAATRAIVREEITAHPLDMNAPAVDFTFSESPAFNDFTASDGVASLVCSIPAAEAIVRRLDLYYNPAQVAPHSYEKTDFIVYYPAEGGTVRDLRGPARPWAPGVSCRPGAAHPPPRGPPCAMATATTPPTTTTAPRPPALTRLLTSWKPAWLPPALPPSIPPRDANPPRPKLPPSIPPGMQGRALTRPPVSFL